MKKRLVGVMMVGMLLTMSTTAFAHGHGGGHHRARTYTVCSVEGCNLTYNHSHNGVVYGGHHSGDGHGYCY